jgi:heme/copper-type cytochrome/quinol oxidase subunit 3
MTGARDFEIVGTLADLPDSATGPRHLVWWGNIGFMVIEGTGFALAAAIYLYLMTQAPTWPPAGDRLPGLFWSGIFTVGLLLSAIPNLWVLRSARAKNLAGVRWGTFVMAIVALLLFVPRGFEFARLGVPWHQDAYGSIIWLLLVLHTVHVGTDWGDTVVLGAWLFTHEVGDNQFADVEDNSNYWTFVILSWIPLYALIYWAPRAL